MKEILEKIKRDHDEANSPYKTIHRYGTSYIDQSKTHHEELLKALEIAIKQRDHYIALGCANSDGPETCIIITENNDKEIEAVLKGCGDV